MKDIRLLSSDTSMTAEAIREPSLQVAINVDAKVQGNQNAKNDAGTILLHVTVNVAVNSAEDSDRALMKIRASWLARYHVKSIEGFSESHLNAFAQWIGIEQVWSYFREYAQSMIYRMGFPQLPIPLYTPASISVVDAKTTAETKKPRRRKARTEK